MTKLHFMTAGESHGPALLAILEGMPAGLRLSEETITKDLVRRQRGFGAGDRMKIEQDQCQLLCGVMAGETTGAPIGLKIDNKDHPNWKGKAIRARTTPRPGHVDLVGAIKYGYNDLRPGLERASARETAARVAIGAICKQLLSFFEIRVEGYVRSIGEVESDMSDLPLESRHLLAEKSSVRCPDVNATQKIRKEISRAIEEGETLGGVIEVLGLNLPVGLGSHVHWDRKLDGRLAQAVMSIPAIKGVEIGNAAENTKKAGTTVQDPIFKVNNQLSRPKNAAGGLEAGITNGQPLIIRAAMKPISTTRKPQDSVDLAKMEKHDIVYERSDVCPVSRAVVVVEAMVAFVLAQAIMEKFGGDNMEQIEQSMKKSTGLNMNALNITPDEKVWWK